MTNWQTIKASDFCLSVRDGTHDSPKRVNNGKYLITSRHIIGNKIDLTNAYKISNSDFDEVNRRSKVDRWDVLLTMIGTVGEVCLVKDEPNFAIKNIGLFKSKNELFGKWLYYFLQSKKVKQVLNSLKRGTTQEYIPLAELRKLNISCPTNIFETQNIISILSEIDDKIENNYKMNETLEKMSCAIFKSWFVDFDPVQAKAAGDTPAHMDAKTAGLFPSSFDDEGLPSGWKKVYLKDLTNIVYGKNLPAKQLVTSGYPVFGGNGVIGFHSEYLYKEPQVLVACRGAASGKVIRSLPYSFVTNNSLVIEISDPHLNRFFLELYLKDLTLEGFTTGSAQPQMTINNMDAVKLLNPTKEILSCFQTVVKPYFDKVFENDEENKTLVELRDTLLPKLMSGEISAKDAKCEVEAAL